MVDFFKSNREKIKSNQNRIANDQICRSSQTDRAMNSKENTSVASLDKPKKEQSLLSFFGLPAPPSVVATASAPYDVDSYSRPCYSWSSPSSSATIIDDIGFLFQNDRRQHKCLSRLSDEDKQRLLREHWTPPQDFDWPYYQKASQKVYLRRNHISGPKYGCFKLSREVQGVVYIPCALYAPDKVPNNSGKMTKLGQLVLESVRNYCCLTGKDSSLDSPEQKILRGCSSICRKFLNQHEAEG